ncbi:protein shisa-1-like [Erythrolamprus reginae]|uniref:protein shisa-1-like n=1 Tax=Erythrolamprus reginae TaxID=121349 RepID=UPI00396C9CC0
MQRLLPRVVLSLFLLSCRARESREDAAGLDPYGSPLSDDFAQCPAHSNASGAPSSRGAQASSLGRGKAGAGDWPAEETRYPWTLLSGVSAGEIGQVSAKESTDAGVLLMEGELCNQWVPGEASPAVFFHCPTQEHQREEMFCCGTCLDSYCCSSTTERLDQASCWKGVQETHEQRAALFAVTPPEKPANNTRLVLGVIGLSCICVWIAMVVSYFQDQKIALNQQSPDNDQSNTERERPATRQAASGDPDPSP